MSSPRPPSASLPPASADAGAWRRFVLVAGAVVLVFSPVLYGLVRFSFTQSLFSATPLIPLVSLYLVWQRPGGLPRPAAGGWPVTVALLALAGAALGAWVQLQPAEPDAGPADRLALSTLAFLLTLGAAVWRCLGPAFVRAAAFPLFFLLFMVPLPTAATAWAESWLQHGSARCADLFFTLAGTTYLREDLVFRLPGIPLQVAPECSGINSTLVLLLTSLLAAFLLLRSPWKRTVLVLLVIPLGLARNGFRIFFLGQLCIRYGPAMIDSWIHHQGGPVFFVLSLGILFAVLLLLLRSERRAAPVRVATAPTS